eukprot:4959500-Pleurochrysis_carterae.AAC.1
MHETRARNACERSKRAFKLLACTRAPSFLATEGIERTYFPAVIHSGTIQAKTPVCAACACTLKCSEQVGGFPEEGVLIHTGYPCDRAGDLKHRTRRKCSYGKWNLLRGDDHLWHRLEGCGICRTKRASLSQPRESVLRSHEKGNWFAAKGRRFAAFAES